jgi:hypothetical protein
VTWRRPFTTGGTFVRPLIGVAKVGRPVYPVARGIPSTVTEVPDLSDLPDLPA